jgi:hypothetical protein
MMIGVFVHIKPDLFSLINFAIEEHPAMTEGFSMAIGTLCFFPLILKPKPSGMGIMPIKFAII